MKWFQSALSICLLALALVICVTLVSPKAQAAEVVDSGTCGNNLTWTLDDTGTLTIVGTGGMPNWKSYSPYRSPWYGDKSVKFVVIEEGVTDIGAYAFESCSSIQNVTLPDSVTSIGAHAFYFCTGLKHINGGNGLTFIGEAAFNACIGLRSINFPIGMKYIIGYAFNNCDNLQEVYFLGSKNQRNMTIQGYNDCLNQAVWYYDHSHQYHELPPVIQEPTCITDGYVDHFCICGENYREILPKCHKAGEDEIVTAPSCVEGGYTQFTCVYCQEWITTDQVSALGHNFNKGTCIMCGAKDPDYISPTSPGDINCDYVTDNRDVLTLLWHTLFEEENPIAVSGDLNGDRYVDNKDVLVLLWHSLFPDENPL